MQARESETDWGPLPVFIAIVLVLIIFIVT